MVSSIRKKDILFFRIVLNGLFFRLQKDTGVAGRGGKSLFSWITDHLIRFIISVNLSSVTALYEVIHIIMRITSILIFL